MEQEEWTVPHLDVLEQEIEEQEIKEHQHDVANEQEITRLQERLEETETKLFALEKLLSTPNLSQFNVSKARRARSSGGGEGRRSSSNRRVATSMPQEQESDEWSEPDKEASRERMGLLEAGAGVGSGGGAGTGAGGRTTEDEVLGGPALATELRRERGRVERLRQEMQEVRAKGEQQVHETRGRCQELEQEQGRAEEQVQEYMHRVESKEKQVQELKLEVTGLTEDVKSFELLYDKLQQEYELLQQEMEGWKELAEDKKQDQDRSRAEDLSNMMSNLEVRDKEIKRFKKETNELETKMKNKETDMAKVKADLESKLAFKESEMTKVKVELVKRRTEVKELQEKEDIKDSEFAKVKSEYMKKKAEVKELKELNRSLEERCEHLEGILNQQETKMFDHEENIRILKYEMERKDKSIASKDENLSTAETLLKELNDAKNETKKQFSEAKNQLLQAKGDLDLVTSTFAEYKKSYNEEIVQNRVNEVETKMKAQAEGMRKFAEELLKIEKKCRRVEQEKQEVDQECRRQEQEMGRVTKSLQEEVYRTSELGKTVEGLRKSVLHLEEERMMKQSLEQELGRMQEQLEQEQEKVLVKEQEVVKVKADYSRKRAEVKELKEKCEHLESRRESAEKVLNALVQEGEQEVRREGDSDKENPGGAGGHDLSKQELEAALLSSRPGSRRQGLLVLDHNRGRQESGSLGGSSSLLVKKMPVTCSCSLASDLETIRTERDAALAKLQATRQTLSTTAERLSNSNRRKREVEKAICKQLTKTHDVLRKTKENLQGAGSS